MTVKENPQFTKDYFDPEKRYIGNSVQVFFKDGSKTDKISIDYPIGHRKRRAEGIPVLVRKVEDALAGHLPARQAARILEIAGDPKRMSELPVHEWMAFFAF
jgi:2-methylcitrate dehydratase